MKSTLDRTTPFSLLLITLALYFLIPEPSAALQRKTVISGRTMGTFYSVTLLEKKTVNRAFLEITINKRLQMINNSMSIYAKNSEISRFNRSESNEPMTISNDFYQVLLTGSRLFDLTSGAWDATVKPLVDLWGFGTKKSITAIPTRENIEATLKTTGFNHILLSKKTIQKTIPNVTVNLGSIAKGFGVDAIARYLKKSGHHTFIVEIGGEVITSGKKASGEPWSVGISKPDRRFADQTLHKIIRLNNKAMATSGDYRNYVTLKGKTYSHIINPVTGYPVTNGVVSASVISDSCTFADGLATALMVMGTQKGLDLVNRLGKTECLIIVRDKNDDLKDFPSKGFNDYLVNKTND